MKSWKRINRSDRKKARFGFKHNMALMNEAMKAITGNPIGELQFLMNYKMDLMANRVFLSAFKRKTRRPVMTINDI